jgi:hypothetical protein
MSTQYQNQFKASNSLRALGETSLKSQTIDYEPLPPLVTLNLIQNMKYTMWKGRSQLNNPIFMPQPHGAYDGMKETVS